MYHYAGNNPVKYVDPDGREVEDSISLTDNQRKMVLEAQQGAIKDIYSLLNRLNEFNSSDDALVIDAKQFLGINVNNKNERIRLIENLNRIGKSLMAMKDTDFKFDPSISIKGENAYVRTKSVRPMYGESLFEKTIYITKSGFSGNLKETLIHETAHKVLNLINDNEIYDLNECIRLPYQMKPLNPSNWAYFISRSK